MAPNGRAYMPQGDNAVVPLGPGYEVLNGTETAQLQAVGALPHYAKGTGGLHRLIENSNKNPKNAWKRDFTSNLKGNLASSLGRGLAQTSKMASNSVGLPWNAEVWSQLQNAMSGGGAGGPVTHSPGSGWGVTSGFGHRSNVGGGYSSHDGVDYYGAKTVHAMNTGKVTHAGGAPSGWGGPRGIGENIVVAGGGLSYIYQELNGKSNSGAKLLVDVGDTVKAGQAIAKLGPAGTHVHVGATHHKMFSIGGSSTAGWLDPREVTSKAIKTSKDSKKSKNPALTKLVKSELGKRLSWVSDKLGEDAIGSIGSLGLAGGVGSRARTLADALRKLYPAATTQGIAAILGNWSFESGLNPGAVNPGGGASGLGQWLGGRKTALINFAKKHNQNWKSAGTQLEFALKGDGANSSIFKRILSGKGSIASLASAFSTQWERGGYTAQHVAGARKVASAIAKHANGGWAKNGKLNVFGEVKGEPEVAINPKRNSADSLIAQVIGARAAANSQSPFRGILDSFKAAKSRKKLKQDIVGGHGRKTSGDSHGRSMPKIEIHNTFQIYGNPSDDQINETTSKLEESVEQAVNRIAQKIFNKFEFDS
ncbi:phage tail tip lysozyme [Secundilactobacillus oryzae]|uniref:phage tail tip lysozyme n=1 Tax=Secundilactobacillus oryzae TaxID=1202668 RepID=UPI000B1614F0|nr:phage tail tip lysozyme [Secundilactobacillus oryzae]